MFKYREYKSFAFLFLLLFISAACHTNTESTTETLTEVTEIDEVFEMISEPPLTSWGIPEDYVIQKQRVRRNQNLSIILRNAGLSHRDIYEISQASSGVYDLRRIVAGNHIILFYDEEQNLKHFVYERSTTDFVHFDLTKDSPAVELGEKQSQTRVQYAEGVINQSLYQTLLNKQLDPSLAYRLADVFAWQVDFYRIQRGDQFRVLYEEEFVDGVSIGVRSIIAAEFDHRNRTYNAFRFNRNDINDYFDSEGNALRGQFLSAPLEYSRISSGFTNRRYHPVLRRNMPHHGTDYAAPTGTPIRAVADGVITVASTDRNNGNWIKIRHNSVYETGYLHMSRFANGIRRGAEVVQGQIIGYVGQTGLATGPHLCYRFWVNGQPADPRRIDLPPSEPIAEELRDTYEEHIFRVMALMQRMKLDLEYEYLLAAIDETPQAEPQVPLTL